MIVALLFAFAARASHAPCAGDLARIRLCEVASTELPPPVTELSPGWLHSGSRYLRLADFSHHPRPPAGTSFTIDGQQYRAGNQGPRGDYTLLRGSPLARPLLARTSLLGFGLADPLAPVSMRVRAEDFDFSPDERLLAIKDGTRLRFVDTGNAQTLTEFTTEPQAPLVSRWASTRLQLVAAFATRVSFFLLDVPTQSTELLFRVERKGGRPTDPVAFLRRTHRIAFADGRVLHLLNERGEGKSIEFPETITDLRVAPDGEHFLAFGRRAARVYDAFDLTRWGEVRAGSDLAWVGFAPDGRIVIALDSGFVTAYAFGG